jgi:hypothetical protein
LLLSGQLEATLISPQQVRTVKIFTKESFAVLFYPY